MSTLEAGAGATHVKRGRKLGDTRAVVARPEARYFRLGPEGTIVAKAAAIEPQRRAARLGFGARRLAFGRVLSSHEELEQRLPKWKALAVFSSDVMSSVAYATEASMFTLLAVGTVAFVVPDADLVPDRRAAVPGHVLLPADDQGVPAGRRQLHRRPPEPGHDPGPGRRGRAPDRLRPHRVRQRVGRRVQPRVRVPRSPRHHRPAHRRRDPPGDGREPAGHEGERHDLRAAHLHLHRQRRCCSWASAWRGRPWATRRRSRASRPSRSPSRPSACCS